MTSRKKSVRRPLPDHLPRDEKVYAASAIRNLRLSDVSGFEKARKVGFCTRFFTSEPVLDRDE